MDASTATNALPVAIARHVEVVATIAVGPRVQRITLAGAELAGFEPLPGQDVVVHLADQHGNGVRRRYTVRNLDRQTGTFDLDVVIHGHGPGSSWGSAARPGDQVEIFGPRGKVLLSGAQWQLFVGDESALPALVEMIAVLPASATVVALVEVHDADDEQVVESAARLDVQWVHRGQSPAGGAQLLAAQLERVDIPDAQRHAYLFGESRVVRRLRTELLARGLRAEEISAKGYWNAGRATPD